MSLRHAINSVVTYRTCFTLRTAGIPPSTIPGSRVWIDILLATVFVILVSCSNVAAEPFLGGIPLTTVKEGTVSGGVYISAYPGFDTNANQQFTLPKYTNIQWARLYVDVYCGHMENNYQAIANVEFDGGSGMKTIAIEELNVPYSFPGHDGSGPVTVNDHCTRVTSDYLMWYDVKDLIVGQTVGAHVKTRKPDAYKGTYDGRVKTITLVVAYDDGDSDEVKYWVNEGHDTDSYQVEEYSGEDYIGETEFSTASLKEGFSRAVLKNVYLASNNGEYTFNRNDLDSSKPLGPYFGIDTWDVDSFIDPGKDSVFTYDRCQNPVTPFGSYFKLFLAVLTVTYKGSEEAGTGHGSGSVGQSESGVRVTSFPNQATIYVDDIEVDTLTNGTLQGVAPGNHYIRVSKEGFEPVKNQLVTILTGSLQKVHFDLVPLTSELTLTSTPAGASISIDGRIISANTPATISSIPAGTHSIVLSLPGYQEYTATITTTVETGARIDAVLFPVGQGGTGIGSSGASGPPMQSPRTPRVAQPQESRSGKMGYAGKTLTTALTGKVKGNLSVATVSDYTGLVYPGETWTFPITPIIPSGARVREARLFMYTTWSHDDKLKEGKESLLTVGLDGTNLTPAARYSDRKGSGIYDYPAETYCFDVTGQITEKREYKVTVCNSGSGYDVSALYGAALVVVYADPAEPEIEYWVAEGSDSLYSNPDFNILDSDAITTANFDGTLDLSGIARGRLLALSTAASGMQGDENLVTFNDGEWENLLSEGSSAISVADIDVTPYLMNEGNEGTIRSVHRSSRLGDYMENRGIILVVTSGTPAAIPSHIKSDRTTTKANIKTCNNAANLSMQENKSVQGPISRIGLVGQDMMKRVIGWSLFLIGLQDSLDENASSASRKGNADFITGSVVAASPASGYRSDDITPTVTRTVTPAVKTERAPSAPPDATPVYVSLSAQLTPATELGNPPVGGIYVSAYPSEADIIVDGRATLSQTPNIIYGLKEGVHTVTVKKEKVTYSVPSKQIYVRGGTVVPANFVIGDFSVRTVRLDVKGFTGDQITVNGNAPPSRPAESIDIEGTGAFVTMLHDGSYLSFKVPDMMQSGSTLSLIENMTFVFPGVQVTSEPPGADVIVDGFKTGSQTPVIFRNISEGIHTIGVQSPGRIPVEKRVILSDTLINDIDHTLPFVMKEYTWGYLSLNSIPQGARITLYGKDSGLKTPAEIPYLAIGKYIVKMTYENTTRSTDAIVIPGKWKNVTLNLKDD